jgi:hypothetical protein
MVLQWSVILYCSEHFLAITVVRVYSMLVRLMSCLLLCVCYVGFSCYLDLWFVPLMGMHISFAIGDITVKDDERKTYDITIVL